MLKYAKGHILCFYRRKALCVCPVLHNNAVHIQPSSYQFQIATGNIKIRRFSVLSITLSTKNTHYTHSPRLDHSPGINTGIEKRPTPSAVTQTITILGLCFTTAH